MKRELKLSLLVMIAIGILLNPLPLFAAGDQKGNIKTGDVNCEDKAASKSSNIYDEAAKSGEKASNVEAKPAADNDKKAAKTEDGRTSKSCARVATCTKLHPSCLSSAKSEKPGDTTTASAKSLEGKGPGAMNNMKTAAFAIKGMVCTGCESTIKTALMEINGVQEVVEISHESGKALVKYDAEKVNPVELASAVSDLGYKTEFVPAETQ